jgi:hypothetical protein
VLQACRVMSRQEPAFLPSLEPTTTAAGRQQNAPASSFSPPSSYPPSPAAVRTPPPSGAKGPPGARLAWASSCCGTQAAMVCIDPGPASRRCTARRRPAARSYSVTVLELEPAATWVCGVGGWRRRHGLGVGVSVVWGGKYIGQVAWRSAGHSMP